MTKIVGIVGKGKGNTGDLPQKQASASKKYCFTHNFEIEENKKVEEDLINKLVGNLSKITNYYIFSLEIGTTNKRRHLQGYCEFKDPVRITGIKNVIENTTNWRKAKGSRQENNTYISKEPIKGPFIYDINTAPLYTAEELGLITTEMLYDWQLDIVDMIKKKPEKRKIYWYWSREGEIGKTEFIKYLMFHYEAKFCQGGKKDIMCNILGKDGKTKARPIYIFGYPRTCEDKISYDALESVKDGLLFSAKYESSDCIIPVPHILVFANFPPDEETMSKDRWIIKNLDKVKTEAQDPPASLSPLDYGIEKFSISFD